MTQPPKHLTHKALTETVTLSTYQGKKNVLGYTHKGLAVTPEETARPADPPQFAVTHTATGYSLIQGLGLNKAWRYLLELSSITDWTQATLDALVASSPFNREEFERKWRAVRIEAKKAA